MLFVGLATAALVRTYLLGSRDGCFNSMMIQAAVLYLPNNKLYFIQMGVSWS